VRVWSSATRKLEYAVGGHTASVNVVKWGGGGLSGHGVLYTASSDRTVRVWDARGVGIFFHLRRTIASYSFPGEAAVYPERPCTLGDYPCSQH